MEQATLSQLSTLRHLLLDRRQALRGEIDAVKPTEPLNGEAQEVTSHADQSVLQQADELADAQLQRDLDELGAVQSALKRLDSTGYGDCVDCGADIPSQRLLAQPSAERCTVCQSAFELANRRRMS